MPDSFLEREPLIALAVLVFGIWMAVKSPHPWFYGIVSVAIAAIVLCFWLRPGYLLLAAPVAAIPILVFGLGGAHSFRDPGGFRMGIVLLAFGLSAWLLPLQWLSRQTPEIKVQLELPVVVLTLIVTGFAVVVGLQLIAMAVTGYGKDAR